MKSTHVSLIDQTAEKLRSVLEKNVYPLGSRLPTYKHLATQMEVSPITMLRALGILKKEKKISSRRKAGIFAGPIMPMGTTKQVDVVKVVKWEKIKDQLKEDVLTGFLHDVEFLPSYKELIEHYKTGFSILKSAIDSLVYDEVLTPYKRGYRIVHFVARSTRRTIYLFINEQIRNFILFSNDRTWIDTFVRTLEKECSNKNIRLVKIRDYNTIKTIDVSDSLVFILWQAQTDSSNIISLINHLKPFNLPIAIFNHTTILTPELDVIYPRINTPETSLFVIDLESGDFRAGFSMGRFLFDRGHRRICFFAYRPDPSQKQYWVDHRLAGLTEAFLSLKQPDAITVFLFGDNEQDCDISAKKASDDKAIFLLNQERKLLNKSKTILNTASFSPHFFEERLLSEIREYEFGMHARQVVMPVFRKALRLRDVTAWVCADDYLANYGALDFLNNENLAIPGKIGLVGFNDQMESSLNDITSYQFDFAGTARKMLHSILFPDTVRRSSRKKALDFFQLDGIVIDRGSA